MLERRCHAWARSEWRYWKFQSYSERVKAKNVELSGEGEVIVMRFDIYYPKRKR